MTEPIAHGVTTGQWKEFGGDLDSLRTKRELLHLWDQATEKLNTIWPTIPAHRFVEVDKAFGQWENANINTVFYGIDDEFITEDRPMFIYAPWGSSHRHLGKDDRKVVDAAASLAGREQNARSTRALN